VSTGTAKYGATLAEGTWSFRVKAVDGRGGESGWVESTQATKVDRSGPSGPVASFGDATLAAGWFKDEVIVSWGDSEDPELADHSAGSGVDESTYTAPTRVTDQDETEVTGTVRDLIGNGSDQGSTTVKVDATAPKLTVTGCPTGPVLERTAVTVKWTASDDESGLDTAAADEIQVDTSQPGSKTVAIPAARDRVGHVTTADNCQFEVYANTAPDAPTGLNEPNSPRASGEFDLTWDAADDPDLGAGDSITYTVEQRNADSDWTTAAEGLTSLTHHVEVADGTWQFRVRAVDSFGATSGWAEFAAVKVDGGKPTSPEMTTDPADAVDGWFKDSVTVSFGGSDDPALDDGSAGSGVAADGYTAPSTLSQTGSHEVSGTATDRAGNESDPTGPATVKVDATAPTTAATCPTGTLIVGEPAKAPWTASDQGSGLATSASGELTLDTSAPGTHTTSADPVRDRVGHQADGASCTYSVAYKFVGFSAPINGSAVNAGKTGRTYPVKWRLQRYDGSLISDADAQALVAAMSAGQKEMTWGSFALLPTDELTESTTGDTSLRYDAGADQFIYNYKAPSTAGCYVLAVRKADGASTRQVNFTFTR